MKIQGWPQYEADGTGFLFQKPECDAHRNIFHAILKHNESVLYLISKFKLILNKIIGKSYANVKRKISQSKDSNGYYK